MDSPQHGYHLRPIRRSSSLIPTLDLNVQEQLWHTDTAGFEPSSDANALDVEEWSEDSMGTESLPSSASTDSVYYPDVVENESSTDPGDVSSSYDGSSLEDEEVQALVEQVYEETYELPVPRMRWRLMENNFEDLPHIHAEARRSISEDFHLLMDHDWEIKDILDKRCIQTDGNGGRVEEFLVVWSCKWSTEKGVQYARQTFELCDDINGHLDSEAKKRDTQFLIVWGGSWVRRSQLENAAPLLQRFDEQHQGIELFNYPNTFDRLRFSSEP